MTNKHILIGLIIVLILLSITHINKEGFNNTTPPISFSTPGEYTWTAPPNVTEIELLVVGGGGGGAIGGIYGGAGFGGGGGGVIYEPSYKVTPGTTYPIIVGEGGNKSKNDNYGTNSVFNNLFLAEGGREGGSMNRKGGTGGITSIGDTRNKGNDGSNLRTGSGEYYYEGGGGGGAGGPGGTGGNNKQGGPGLNYNISGTNTVYGSGGRGGTSSIDSNGANGVGYGNGGGGGGGTGTNRVGGNGSSGIVIINYGVKQFEKAASIAKQQLDVANSKLREANNKLAAANTTLQNAQTAKTINDNNIKTCEDNLKKAQAAAVGPNNAFTVAQSAYNNRPSCLRKTLNWGLGTITLTPNDCRKRDRLESEYNTAMANKNRPDFEVTKYVIQKTAYNVAKMATDISFNAAQASYNSANESVKAAQNSVEAATKLANAKDDATKKEAQRVIDLSNKEAADKEAKAAADKAAAEKAVRDKAAAEKAAVDKALADKAAADKAAADKAAADKAAKAKQEAATKAAVEAKAAADKAQKDKSDASIKAAKDAADKAEATKKELEKANVEIQRQQKLLKDNADKALAESKRALERQKMEAARLQAENAANVRALSAMTQAAAAKAAAEKALASKALADKALADKAAADKAAADKAEAAKNTVIPKKYDIVPDTSSSKQTLEAKRLQERKTLIQEIQQTIKNEILALRNTTPLTNKPLDKATTSTTQGKEYKNTCYKGTQSRCPKNPDGTCPPIPDMSNYIKKDEIPCWGCSIDY